jgi:hypothetical protein
MTPAITLWLAFVLVMAVVCRRDTTRRAMVFAILAFLILPASFIPLGHAAPWQPAPGHYAVLGAKIEVDVAIYVLLDSEDGPRFYRLPYTTGTANALQASLDAALGSGGTVGADIDGEGSPGFAEEGGGAAGEVKEQGREVPLL